MVAYEPISTDRSDRGGGEMEAESKERQRGGVIKGYRRNKTKLA